MTVARSLLMTALLLGGCCRSEPAPPARHEIKPQPPVKPQPALLTRLTGRYQDAASAGAGRLCIIEGKRTVRFGIVIGGGSAPSCSGSGTVSRRRNGLRLAMSGDSPCAWRVGIEGDTLIFPADMPPGCRYYCGAGATLAGVRLRQIGTGSREAMKAKDLVGDPLCADS